LSAEASLERKRLPCAECAVAGWREPCPGVDGALFRLEPRPPTGAPLCPGQRNVLGCRERRARSEPAPLAEEGEARAALDPPALGDCRDKLSAPGATQKILVTSVVDDAMAVRVHAF